MNTNVTFNPDKFGYYTTLDQKIKSYRKQEILEISNFKKIHWNFNDSIFSSINTKIEPKMSLREMYIERCHQIRNSYDYVVLLYSGGSDSHNILMHWIDSGCKLDEIATYHSYEATKHKYDLSNFEQFNVVLPQIENIKNKVEFKFRWIDVSNIIIKNIIQNQNDIIYNSNVILSPRKSSQNIFRNEISEWKKIIDSGKKLCLVWGIEKTKVFLHNNKLHFKFSDAIDSAVSPYILNNYKNGWYDELFYWTPDFPEICIKQAHTIKNFFNFKFDSRLNRCPITSFYLSNFIPQKSYGYNRYLKSHLSDDGYRQLMYPYWDIKTWQSPKIESITNGLPRFERLKLRKERDQWLFDSNTRESDIFTSQLKKFKGDNTIVESNLYPIE